MQDLMFEEKKMDTFRELSENELDEVMGGVVPLAVAAYWSAGFLAGVYGGWTFGSALYIS